MTDLFLKVINLSYAASFLILACIMVRFIFRGMPKYMRCFLWILVAARLVIPFSIESPLSVLPTRDLVSYKSDSAEVNSEGYSNFLINAPDEKNVSLLAFIWMTGVMAILIYGIVMYIRLSRYVRDAVRLCDNVYQTDKIVSPFILGIIKPRIYIPCDISLKDQFFVLKHERVHIARKDHLIKPAAFVLTAFYWFNPLLWVAYVLLCRDIELACDEKVISLIGYNKKKEYSQAILNLSMPRNYISACPVAFGETGVKERISSVLNMKKSKKIVIAAAVVLIAAVGIGFLTFPKKSVPDKKVVVENSDKSQADAASEGKVELEIDEKTAEESTTEVSSDGKEELNADDDTDKKVIIVDETKLIPDEDSDNSIKVYYETEEGKKEEINVALIEDGKYVSEDGSFILNTTLDTDEGDNGSETSIYTEVNSSSLDD